MADNAILIDATRCSGCQSCQIACKGWNDLPAEKEHGILSAEYTWPLKLSAMTWTHVYYHQPVKNDDGSVRWNFFPRMCNHCRDANCIRVCPEHAISSHSGWVIINQEKCIGCGACVEVCIYHVPGISDIHHMVESGKHVLRKDRAYKCTACKTERGEIPSCVTSCPTGALSFGNRLSILKGAEARIKLLKKKYPRANLYGTEQYGGLRVLTLLPDRPELFSLPENPPFLDSVSAESARSIYTFLSFISPGLPGIKRVLYRVARGLGKNGGGIT